MKKIILFAVLSISSFTGLMAQKDRYLTEGMKAFDGINLKEDQRAQLSQIFEEYNGVMNELNAYDNSDADIQRKKDDLNADLKKRVSSVLTTEQMSEYNLKAISNSNDKLFRMASQLNLSPEQMNKFIASDPVLSGAAGSIDDATTHKMATNPLDPSRVNILMSILTPEQASKFKTMLDSPAAPAVKPSPKPAAKPAAKPSGAVKKS